MSAIADTAFKITNTKLYVPVVTLSSKSNVKLVKLLEEGFKRPVYWNEHQKSIESRNLDNMMLLFKELEDCLFFLLKILIMVIKNWKK